MSLTCVLLVITYIITICDGATHRKPPTFSNHNLTLLLQKKKLSTLFKSKSPPIYFEISIIFHSYVKYHMSTIENISINIIKNKIDSKNKRKKIMLYYMINALHISLTFLLKKNISLRFSYKRIVKK